MQKHQSSLNCLSPCLGASRGVNWVPESRQPQVLLPDCSFAIGGGGGELSIWENRSCHGWWEWCFTELDLALFRNTYSWHSLSDSVSECQQKRQVYLISWGHERAASLSPCRNCYRSHGLSHPASPLISQARLPSSRLLPNILWGGIRNSEFTLITFPAPRRFVMEWANIQNHPVTSSKSRP